MKFCELTEQYLDKTDKDFPFDATDMARFILQTLKGKLPQIPNEIQRDGQIAPRAL